VREHCARHDAPVSCTHTVRRWRHLQHTTAGEAEAREHRRFDGPSVRVRVACATSGSESSDDRIEEPRGDTEWRSATTKFWRRLHPFFGVFSGAARRRNFCAQRGNSGGVSGTEKTPKNRVCGKWHIFLTHARFLGGGGGGVKPGLFLGGFSGCPGGCQKTHFFPKIAPGWIFAIFGVPGGSKILS
jgi:hypothetical protein